MRARDAFPRRSRAVARSSRDDVDLRARMYTSAAHARDGGNTKCARRHFASSSLAAISASSHAIAQRSALNAHSGQRLEGVKVAAASERRIVGVCVDAFGCCTRHVARRADRVSAAARRCRRGVASVCNVRAAAARRHRMISEHARRGATATLCGASHNVRARARRRVQRSASARATARAHAPTFTRRRRRRKRARAIAAAAEAHVTTRVRARARRSLARRPLVRPLAAHRFIHAPTATTRTQQPSHVRARARVCACALARHKRASTPPDTTRLSPVTNAASAEARYAKAAAISSARPMRPSQPFELITEPAGSRWRRRWRRAVT